jgi:hypothetical protein
MMFGGALAIASPGCDFRHHGLFPLDVVDLAAEALMTRPLRPPHSS